jgi:hypothetical protein
MRRTVTRQVGLCGELILPRFGIFSHETELRSINDDEEVGVVPLGEINCDGREIPTNAPDLSESDDVREHIVFGMLS